METISLITIHSISGHRRLVLVLSLILPLRQAAISLRPWMISLAMFLRFLTALAVRVIDPALSQLLQRAPRFPQAHGLLFDRHLE